MRLSHLSKTSKKLTFAHVANPLSTALPFEPHTNFGFCPRKINIFDSGTYLVMQQCPQRCQTHLSHNQNTNKWPHPFMAGISSLQLQEGVLIVTHFVTKQPDCGCTKSISHHGMQPWSKTITFVGIYVGEQS